MLMVFLECLFEMFMTQVALYDIYCHIAFANIARSAGYNALAAMSGLSVVLVALPKMYGMYLNLRLLFNCGALTREEDTRRKWAHRLLTIDESRMQALSVEYTRFEREKTELLMAFYKFLVEDGP